MIVNPSFIEQNLLKNRNLHPYIYPKLQLTPSLVDELNFPLFF